MRKMLIAYEWAYSLTCGTWPFIKHKPALKIIKHADIARYYIVGTILRHFFAFLVPLTKGPPHSSSNLQGTILSPFLAIISIN